MKLLFLNGSRGEWGYIQPVVDECRRRKIDYDICVTNMVMLPSYGALIKELRAEGYNISDEIYMSLEGHSRHTMAKSLAVFLSSFTDVLRRIDPTWLVIAGDRGEQLMGAVAGAYTYVPTAHIQAGELSGNIDGVSRHAIGKFAHIHFAANKDAADRLQKLGEEEFRIKLVGHPALDPIAAGTATDAKTLSKKYDIDLSSPPILVVMHPVTEDYERVEEQMTAMTDALAKFPQRKIWILSNNDAGAHKLRAHVLRNRTSDISLYENLTRADYLGFLKSSACIVGNSSSGLLEAPSFKLPAVNIGRRQYGRMQGSNVINASFKSTEIEAAIKKALSPEFRKTLDGSNPYGDGSSAKRILDTLEATPVDDKLLVKRLTY